MSLLISGHRAAETEPFHKMLPQRCEKLVLIPTPLWRQELQQDFYELLLQKTGG